MNIRHTYIQGIRITYDIRIYREGWKIRVQLYFAPVKSQERMQATHVKSQPKTPNPKP
jgi:hypothetical protein